MKGMIIMRMLDIILSLREFPDLAHVVSIITLHMELTWLANHVFVYCLGFVVHVCFTHLRSWFI